MSLLFRVFAGKEVAQILTIFETGKFGGEKKSTVNVLLF